MQKVAQAWLITTLAGANSAFFLGLDSLMGELPILLLTLVGGVIADRKDRRQLLLLSQYTQMASAFILASLVYFDVVRLWHILALSAMTGVAQAFGGPAYQSMAACRVWWRRMAVRAPPVSTRKRSPSRSRRPCTPSNRTRAAARAGRRRTGAARR